MADIAAPADSRPYFQRDENRFVPSEMARGGWGPSLSGHVVGGLLGWAVERAVDDPQLHPTRLTVDLPRPTALEPLEVHTTVHHDRRRLRLVEAVVVQAGAPVARASALFLRRGPQPGGGGVVTVGPDAAATTRAGRFADAVHADLRLGLPDPKPRSRMAQHPRTEIHLVARNALTDRRRTAQPLHPRRDGRRHHRLPRQLGHQRACSSSTSTTPSR